MCIPTELVKVISHAAAWVSWWWSPRIRLANPGLGCIVNTQCMRTSKIQHPVCLLQSNKSPKNKNTTAAFYVDQNAAMVPHAAITTAMTNKIMSQTPHLPSMALFADIGPMTHSMKAEKDPRKAITMLNSGTRMETPTDRNANIMRSTTVRIRLSVRCGTSWGLIRVESVSGLAERSSGEAGGGLVSSPSMISSVIFNGRVQRANFDRGLMTSIHNATLLR